MSKIAWQRNPPIRRNNENKYLYSSQSEQEDQEVRLRVSTRKGDMEWHCQHLAQESEPWTLDFHNPFKGANIPMKARSV